MTITLSPELFALLQERAHEQHLEPQILVEKILRQHLMEPHGRLPTPQDDWERLLLNAAIDCGVSLTDEAVSSEGIYE